VPASLFSVSSVSSVVNALEFSFLLAGSICPSHSVVIPLEAASLVPLKKPDLRRTL